jgi:hypothetical protein
MLSRKSIRVVVTLLVRICTFSYVPALHSYVSLSTVLYIPAVPLTPQNAEYIRKQKECFLQGRAPPDFPKVQQSEADLIGVGKPEDIVEKLAREAMGLSIGVA